MSGTNRSGRRGTSGSVGRASVGSAPVVPGGPGASGASGASGARKKKRSTIPRWARVCTILGAVLMVVSGGLLVTSEALLARYEGAVTQEDLFGDGQTEKRADIEGPLNILLVGIDPRDSEALPLADSIMILHVPASHDRAYLFSLPRDLVVDIPPFQRSGYNGGTGKLNSAMAHGSQTPGGKPDRARGFELLSKTVSRYTGIERFDAGGIVNFNGFKKIVDAMGGVTMYIDQDVESEHMQPNGEPRPNNGSGSAHPYYGPQAEYKKGTRHLKGWQALDYVRQRYGLPKGDYDRQRHQQQFVRAMAKQALSAGVVTNPIKLDKVLRAAGQAVVFNGRGHSVADFGWALRNLREDSIMMVKLEGGGVGTGRNYQGEALNEVSRGFLDSVRTGTVDQYMVANPQLVNRAK
jgi:anionic cell wall polymer biosynthesis LytR-Cps2A-Psr (LCP) family protein